MNELNQKRLTLKDIAEMEKKFMDNPRKSITRLLEESSIHMKRYTHSGVFKGNMSRLILLKEVHLEYAKLIGKIDISKIDFTVLRDRINDLSAMQKLEECNETVLEYITNPNNNTPIKLARAYASSCEIFWKKMKKLLLITGITNGGEHITVGKLCGGIEELERKYSIGIPKIKSFINSKLRNSINHEDAYFDSPYIVFLDNKGEKPVEIARLTVAEVYDLLVEQSIITSALLIVENDAIMSRISPLLILTDSELDEVLKTGKLTESAKLKFEELSAKIQNEDK